MFAVVLSDSFIDVKVDKEGKGILELENGKILKAFRISALSRISRIVNNQSEIKLTVVESLLDIQNRFDIKGWVRESEIADFNTLFNRNQELFERNNALEKMLKESENRPQSLTKSYFNNLSFLEIKNILSTLEVNMRDNEKASILTLFINFADFLITGLEYNIHNGFNHEGADFHFCIDFVFPKLKILGLAINEKMKETTIYSLTENGERFMAEYFIENLGLDKSC